MPHVFYFIGQWYVFLNFFIVFLLQILCVGDGYVNEVGELGFLGCEGEVRSITCSGLVGDDIAVPVKFGDVIFEYILWCVV